MAQKVSGRLNHAVALRVVNTIAPRIDYPLNIMDAGGLIIASSDPQRIGQLHPDAQVALAEQRTVITHETDRATGRRPGVNVPLYLDGELQGVLGVTGDPHAVAPLAQLISLTVQLLLDQQEEHLRATLRMTQGSDMLSGLISGVNSAQVIAGQLQLLDFPEPWSLSLVRFEGGRMAPGTTANTVVLSAGNDAWILSSRSRTTPRILDAASQRIIGTPRTSVEQLMLDAQNWRTLAGYPGLLPREQTEYLWDVDLALSLARTPAAQGEVLASRTRRLNHEQARTVLVLSKVASQVEATEQLNVHRNTLIQRMERIKQVTGYDPRVAGELFGLLHSIYARAQLGELPMFDSLQA